MPRPSKYSTGGSQTLSGSQAQYVLSRLIRDRRVHPGDISRALDEMQVEIRQLEQQLAMLRAVTGVGGGAVPVRRGPGRPPRSLAGYNGDKTEPSAAPKKRRRRKAASPETQASRKLQGQYLGYIRQIPEYKRGKIKKLAKEKGREAAIKEMRSTLGK